MGIFSRDKRKTPEPPPSDLEERMRKLESSMRQLEDDFVDLWDRQRRRIGREAKRGARDNAPELTPEEQINQRILALRGMRPINGD
jgi:hypothetical protein